MDTTPQVSAISDGVVFLLSDMLSHLSVHLKEKKACDASGEEMAAWLKLPKKPSVITPPYLRGAGPSVTTPSVPSSRRSKGTKARCHFNLTKGIRKGQKCARAASNLGIDSEMYCGSHIGKVGAANGGTPPVTQHQIPGPNVPAPVAVPVKTGVPTGPTANSRREVNVDPLKDVKGEPVPGKYLEKNTDFVIEANATGGGTVIGKWENNVIRETLTSEEKEMAIQMGLGIVTAKTAMPSHPGNGIEV